MHADFDAHGVDCADVVGLPAIGRRGTQPVDHVSVVRRELSLAPPSRRQETGRRLPRPTRSSGPTPGARGRRDQIVAFGERRHAEGPGAERGVSSADRPPADADGRIRRGAELAVVIDAQRRVEVAPAVRRLPPLAKRASRASPCRQVRRANPVAASLDPGVSA